MTVIPELIEGAAGIGKTRLLAEARSLATGFDLLTARAGELESDFEIAGGM